MLYIARCCFWLILHVGNYCITFEVCHLIKKIALPVSSKL